MKDTAGEFWVRAGRPFVDACETEERYPATRRTVAFTRLQVGLEAGDETDDALRDMLGELLKDHAAARRIATLIEG